MELDCKRYRTWFLNYVKEYGNEPEVIIKKEHSFRVASSMKDVFQALDLNDEYISLAELIGLYHDIGRFEQWRKYHTFFDGSSVDHAQFGADILLCTGMIKQIYLERYYDFLIYDSIKYHNILSLPSELSIKDESVFKSSIDLEKVLKNYMDYEKDYKVINSLYAMAIRDADKLDILKQYTISDYLLKSDDIPVSPKVEEAFFANRPISKEDRKTKNDSMVLRLSFINDINLTKFLKLIRDENILERINLIYPNKELVQPYFDYAYKRLDELIDDNKKTQYVLKK